MPILPKIFKRRRTTPNTTATVTSGPASYTFAKATDSERQFPLPVPELRRGVSLPQLVLPKNGLSDDLNASLTDSQVLTDVYPVAGKGAIQLSESATFKVLPPTPVLDPANPEATDEMAAKWRAISNRDTNISKEEKIMNKLTDNAGGTVSVVAESSSDGVISMIKGVVTNEEMQAVGKAISEHVPEIMSVLEKVTDIHPFLKAAFLPFKLIYYQETQRRDNDGKRSTLFEKIKDVMLILMELKKIPKDDTRITPEGEPILSRLASICRDMKKDIEGCYNVLNAQERRSVSIKFLKASSWNKELATYAARFTTTRENLTFTLSMRSAVTTEETNTNVIKMMEMFATMMSPQEKDMGRWIQNNGGEEEVLKDNKKTLEMIKYEAKFAPNGPAGKSDKRKPGASDEDSSKDEAKAIADLRKEYRQDIQSIIQENLESYSKRFQMGLDDLAKDLESKIKHEGDRVIKYLQGGPHSRIKDKMVYHVWKDQGWKGSAKARTLVLAIRDYLVERVEHSKLGPAPRDAVQKRPTSTVPNDDDDDTEGDMSVPLPDSWMTAYLQVKRLRYLQQALDADSSGFTTIFEINTFTRARPTEWSLPRWISYWTIGWQIFATKYCIEIEELFAQMFLLNTRIGIQMPGNKRYVNDYIEGTWKFVTTLTSSIERYDSPPQWLEGKFTDYVAAQEKMLGERLEKIKYRIDALETIALILRGGRIEESIFSLLALLLRRHVAKMHLCLKQEIDSKELDNDMNTVMWVIFAVWQRFNDLKEYFQHQQVFDLKQTFEWLSCGLFKNYWDFGDWVSRKHFMDNDMTAWSSIKTIKELKPSELIDLLTYTDQGTNGKIVSKSHPEDSHSDTTPTSPPSPAAAENPGAITVVDAQDTTSAVPSNSVVSQLSVAEMSITGTWYGWHWTETKKPFMPMIKLNIECGARQAESETRTVISGEGFAVDGYPFVLHGTIDSANQPQESLGLDFQRVFNDDGTSIQYNGTFLHERQVLTGTFERKIAKGSFMFKKVPRGSILCLRPLAPVLKTGELWRFAYNAVVDNIRRQKLGSSYLCERMIKMHKALELLLRDNLGLLSEDEIVEQSDIHKCFSFEEMSELYKLYFWYDRAADLQPMGYTCDGCRQIITRSRVVCLDCISTDRPDRTVDFCSKPECIASRRIPQREDVSHLPSHLMMKTRDFFLLKDYYMFKQRSQYALSHARRIYKDDLSLTVPLPASPVAPDEEASTTVLLITHNDSAASPATISLPLLDTTMSVVASSGPIAEKSPDTASSGTTNILSIPDTPDGTTYIMKFSCITCSERVLTPCWFCVDCYDWVCDSCEQAINKITPWAFQKRYREEVSGPEDADMHNIFHLLVYVARKTTEEAKFDGDHSTSSKDAEHASPLGQWDRIEKRIQELVSERFEAANNHVDGRLEEVEARLTSRLVNMERLLDMIAAQRA
ncbi:hypothetical protein B0H11DRAFT_2036023 [Mycena galericulata]|nr:hypothetical protein B0H11DRAFT_2036023 [Mycena galericulata]